MGSTSSEGQGHGAALQTKGPGNNREFYKTNVATEVVAAGRGLTAADGTDTVSFPALDGGYNGTFVVHITAENVNFRAGLDALSVDADNNFNGFDVASQDATTNAAAAAWYIWSVIKRGTPTDTA